MLPPLSYTTPEPSPELLRISTTLGSTFWMTLSYADCSATATDDPEGETDDEPEVEAGAASRPSEPVHPVTTSAPPARAMTSPRPARRRPGRPRRCQWAVRGE